MGEQGGNVSEHNGGVSEQGGVSEHGGSVSE